MTQRSRQWSISGYGTDRLEETMVEVADPGDGEVLVRVEAVSLNYRDRLMLESGMGSALTFPFVPTSDMAGVVEAVGPQASRFVPGDRVISTFYPGWIEGNGPGDARTPPYKALGGFYPGMLTERLVMPQDWLVAAPATLDAGEASTLPCAGLTAWTALIEKGPLKPGDRVLVKGTGGVALFGLQLAKAQGADVFITSSSQAKLDRAGTLGADHRLMRDDWVEQVIALTDGHGIDHILDLAGGPAFAQSLGAVAVGGRISLIGVFEGFDLSGPAGPMLTKAPVVQGISVGHRRALEDLVRAVDAIGLKPVIDGRYGFEGVPEAFAHLARGPFGKVVVKF